MNIQPYLSFEGRAEEAIEFYKSTLGATVEMLLRFKDMPADQQSMITPGTENKVMHASIKVGETSIPLSDGQCGGKAVFSGITLILNADSDGEAERLFGAIAGSGGQVRMPITETFFATRFGICADKFGVAWMVMNPKP